MKTKLRSAWEWITSWFGPVRWQYGALAFMVGGAIGVFLAAHTAR